MAKQEELEKELKSHWNNTKEERERTHTGVFYEELLKNKKKWNMKKRTIFLILLNVGLVVFVFMSLTFYYMMPTAESVINYLRKLVEEFIRLFV